jgi:apolipoprotein N-acyltransferase
MRVITTIAGIVLIVLCVLFTAACLKEIAQKDVRTFNKWVWAIICIVSIPFGSMLYFFFGRNNGRAV